MSNISLESFFPAAPAYTAEWAPLYWSPVLGGEERLMVGVVARCGNEWKAHRIIRDDLFRCLYGKRQGDGAKAMVDMAIDMLRSKLPLVDWCVDLPISGFALGKLRMTQGDSVQGVIRQAVALESALSRPDVVDDVDAEGEPAPENVNLQWVTKIKEAVRERKPALLPYFDQEQTFYDEGVPVKFGFINAQAIAHFGLLRLSALGASIRDARSRLWELDIAHGKGERRTGLVIGIPSAHDVTISGHQYEKLKRALTELEYESADKQVLLKSVESAEDGADALIRLAA